MQQPNELVDIINTAYDGFNKRDIDAVLALMTANVKWPNGWEGGYVSGQEEVRTYWTRQWKELNPVVTPSTIHQRAENVVEVTVKQLVKDLKGNVLSDSMVKHVYTFDKGKITGMEIENV